MYSGTLDPPFRPDEASFRHAEERKELTRRLRENPYSFSSVPQEEEREAENLIMEERSCERCEQAEQNERGSFPVLSGLKTEEVVILFLLALLFAENEKKDFVGIAILLYLLLFE